MSTDKFGNTGHRLVWDMNPAGDGPPVNIIFDSAIDAREAVSNDPDRYCYELPCASDVWIWDLAPEDGSPPRSIKVADQATAKKLVDTDPLYSFRLPKR